MDRRSGDGVSFYHHIEGTDHWLQVWKSDVTNTLMTDFINATEYKPSSAPSVEPSSPESSALSSVVLLWASFPVVVLRFLVPTCKN